MFFLEGVDFLCWPVEVCPPVFVWHHPGYPEEKEEELIAEVSLLALGQPSNLVQLVHEFADL